ncbi:MAG: acetyl-CoA carboxylase carboxyltransferase subunit alpha [Bdellovibrionales bacterium GWA2_49_15]|nr:MAG: acetyl-CoA carboxylase carboxyltransferase subunit alpha [Bdellovibrionales bacterium GWA2_49_15]
MAAELLSTLEFEKPIVELENQIREMRGAASQPGNNLDNEIRSLEAKVSELLKNVYGKLGTWERVLLSRHFNRPHTIDYIQQLITEFHPLSGDRHFADDPSMIAGLGYFQGEKIAIIGIEKGQKTKEKIHHNFGMPRPEGYRKAIRVMELAGRFGIPILTLVDTPGAFPGVEAEERGQATAIAENLEKMFRIPVPIISVIIGEGGSGGALAIAIADKVMMMEYSIYSVISPESCASILWSDPKMADVAAKALHLTPAKALELGVADQIIPEPLGGAHRNHNEAAQLLAQALKQNFASLKNLEPRSLVEERYRKFRTMGNSTLALPNNK